MQNNNTPTRIHTITSRKSTAFQKIVDLSSYGYLLARLFSATWRSDVQTTVHCRIVPVIPEEELNIL